MIRPAIIMLCALAALTAACASSKPTNFYTLSSLTSPSAAIPSKYSISVGPVSVPALVDRSQIVLQNGPNQVYIAEFHRWAAPLKSDIARVVADNLSVLFGAAKVTIFPQQAADDDSYRIVIDIARFESVAGNAATLDAGWTVSCRIKGQSLNGRTRITEPVSVDNYVELAAAHSRALGKMSTEIAAAIIKLSGQKM